MEQVRKSVNESQFAFMPGKQVGISCGIYEYRGEDIEAEEIFNRADQAMYHAKKSGRNQCVCYRDINP
jgi:diguanylate cyclase (GGDEF)-like protein